MGRESAKLKTMRVLSLIVALGYVVLGMLAADSVVGAIGHGVFVCAVLVLPLACIWFADEIGDYVGWLPGPSINKRTPGAFVKVGGWILLLLPLAAYWLTQR
jgi:hypothetical protein